MLIRDEYLTCKCSFNKSITVLLSKQHYTTLGFQALLNLLWEQIKEMSVCDESLNCSQLYLRSVLYIQSWLHCVCVLYQIEGEAVLLLYCLKLPLRCIDGRIHAGHISHHLFVDSSKKDKASQVYFYSGFIAYFVGLVLTVLVMHTFKAAQPALLYLVPACLGTPIALALIRGEISELFK